MLIGRGAHNLTWRKIMTSVSVNQTLSTTNNLVSFDLEMTLLQKADLTLAKAIIKAIKKSDSFFFNKERFNPYQWDLTDDSAQKTLLGAFKQAQKAWINWSEEEYGEKTNEGYKSLLNDLVGEALTDIGHNYDYQNFHSDAYYEEFHDLAECCVESLVEAAKEQDIDFDDEIESEEFAETLRELAIEAIADADKSTYVDILPTFGSLEFNFTYGFDNDEQYIDDFHIEHESNCSSLETIIVDERLENFFSMANISSVDFAKHLEQKGYSSELVEKYKNLKPTNDENLPARMTCDNVIEVLDNATYGGIPMITFFANVSDLLKADPERGFYINKGALGLEDVINGSGHNEDLDISNHPMLIKFEDIKYLNAPLGYSRDEVYGFYRPSLKTDLIEAN